jgi:hypothetical protein
MTKTPLAVSAVVLAGLAAPAFAIDIPLPNGGFDTGSPASNTFGLITNWTVQSVPTSGFASSVWTSYAGFVPNNGTRMALISNRDTVFVQMSNATPIELQGMPQFNFWMVYLTTDPTSTALANRDQFAVVVDYFSDAGGVNQIGTESFTINTGSLFSTGINPGQPFNAVVNAGNGPLPPTQLGLVVIPLSLPSAPYANFTFYLDNLGTGTGTSGVLIDNVFISPEPGTMALFGLGALGLGGLAWRRRRAKLASKAPAAPTA